MAAPALLIGQGKPIPLGLNQSKHDFNSAIFSRHATGIGLLIFGGRNEQPIEVIALDRNCNRSGSIWHSHLSSDM